MRMTKQRKELIEKMREGVTIVTEKTDFGGLNYSLSDGGSVSQDVVERMVQHGVFQPCGDGLFGDSQSFKLAEGSACGE